MEQVSLPIFSRAWDSQNSSVSWVFWTDIGDVCKEKLKMWLNNSSIQSAGCNESELLPALLIYLNNMSMIW